MTVAPEKLSPLALAYIGDAVYELAVREYLLGRGEAHNKDPVSYTHLDVYKRQLLPRQKPLLIGRAASNSPRQCGGGIQPFWRRARHRRAPPSPALRH